MIRLRNLLLAGVCLVAGTGTGAQILDKESFLNALEVEESEFLGNIGYKYSEEYLLHQKPKLEKSVVNGVIKAELIQQGAMYQYRSSSNNELANGNIQELIDMSYFDGRTSIFTRQLGADNVLVANIWDRPAGYDLARSLHRQAIRFSDPDGHKLLSEFLREPVVKGNDWETLFRGQTERDGELVYRIDVEPINPLSVDSQSGDPVTARWTLLFDPNRHLFPIRFEIRVISGNDLRLLSGTAVTDWISVGNKQLPAGAVFEAYGPDGTVLRRALSSFESYDLAPDHPIEQFRIDLPNGALVHRLAPDRTVIHSYVVGETSDSQLIEEVREGLFSDEDTTRTRNNNSSATRSDSDSPPANGGFQSRGLTSSIVIIAFVSGCALVAILVVYRRLRMR